MIGQMLDHLEPIVTIGALLFVVAMLMVVPGVLVILGRKEEPGRPESHSERAHRVDSDARDEMEMRLTRRTSSNRKPGRA